MAGNRRKQSSAVRFGPLLKVVLLCGFIGGAALGYVWQKSQLASLGHTVTNLREEFKSVAVESQRRQKQLALIESRQELERRTREFNLGLMPTRQEQVVHLQEPPVSAPLGAASGRGPFARLDASDVPRY